MISVRKKEQERDAGSAKLGLRSYSSKLTLENTMKTSRWKSYSNSIKSSIIPLA